MKIYQHRDQTSYRSPSTCSYCGSKDHDIRTCPNAQKDWDNGWKDYKIPLATTEIKRSWMKNPRYWGEWYTKCKETIQKQQRAKENPVIRKSKPVSERYCGFCGNKGHTRRNCGLLQSFVFHAQQANASWRKQAYNHLTNKVGLTVGSVIKVLHKPNRYGDGEPLDKIATITDINYDQLSIGCAHDLFRSYECEDFRSGLSIKIVCEGKIETLSTAQNNYYHNHTKIIGQAIHDDDIFSKTAVKYNWNSYGGGHHSHIFNGVLSKAPETMTRQQLNNFITGYKEAFKFLAKKRSYERLEQAGFIRTVERWSGVDRNQWYVVQP